MGWGPLSKLSQIIGHFGQMNCGVVLGVFLVKFLTLHLAMVSLDHHFSLISHYFYKLVQSTRLLRNFRWKYTYLGSGYKFGLQRINNLAIVCL